MKAPSKLDQLRAMREAKATRKPIAYKWMSVTPSVTVTEPVTHSAIKTMHAMAGQPCPLCGQRVPTKRSAAERQRLSRARRKGSQ